VIRVTTRRSCRYSGPSRSRLWRALGAGLALALAASAGGCSVSYQLDSVFGSDKTDTTASIMPPPGAKPAEELPPDADLAFARAAANAVLTRGSKDVSQTWENPSTGARGTVTPIAQAYSSDGKTCRDFLASYVRGSAQSWLKGEACKPDKGAWQVRSIKPWKSS
jgi:surface antigen